MSKEVRGDARLVTEARTMISRRREPVISRLPSGDFIRVAEVIVGHGDCASRVDSH